MVVNEFGQFLNDVGDWVVLIPCTPHALPTSWYVCLPKMTFACIFNQVGDAYFDVIIYLCRLIIKWVKFHTLDWMTNLVVLLMF